MRQEAIEPASINDLNDVQIIGIVVISSCQSAMIGQVLLPWVVDHGSRVEAIEILSANRCHLIGWLARISKDEHWKAHASH
jgi:hypothetical protein